MVFGNNTASEISKLSKISRAALEKLKKEEGNLSFYRKDYRKDTFVEKIVWDSLLALCFLYFSVVSKAYRSDEHAGSVHSVECRNGYCIPDNDCRNLLEKKSEANVDEQNPKVGDYKTFLLDYRNTFHYVN